MGGTGLRSFDQSTKRFLEGVVAGRAANQAVLSNLGEACAALRASWCHDIRLATNGELGNQLVALLLPGHGHSGLTGMVHAKVHFLLHTMGNGHFVDDGRFVT